MTGGRPDAQRSRTGGAEVRGTGRWLCRVLAAALALGIACSSPPKDRRWSKQGGSAEELEHVQAYCDILARRKSLGSTLKQFEDKVRKFYYSECMNAAGWHSERADAGP